MTAWDKRRPDPLSPVCGALAGQPGERLANPLERMP
jgi:hypothetical protein